MIQLDSLPKVTKKNLAEALKAKNKFDWRYADLSNTDLLEADLSYLNLRGANLFRSSLWRATLRGTILSGANPSESNMLGADLDGAELYNVNLSVTDLDHSNLRGAKGIIALYIPFASSRGDYLYAVDHRAAETPAIMIKAGCFWGTIYQFRERVIDGKPDGHIYMDMADLIERAWAIAVTDAVIPHVETLNPILEEDDDDYDDDDYDDDDYDDEDDYDYETYPPFGSI